MTFVQRSDGALRLNVHLHTLALDGVYVRNADKTLEFHALAPPTTAEVYAVAKRMNAAQRSCCAPDIVGRLSSPYRKYGCGNRPSSRALATERGFAFVRLESAACVRQWVCTLASPFVAEVGGVNIHAGVAVHGDDRSALGGLWRYMTRPPIALDWLTRRDDGCVEYAFRKPWRDGTRAARAHGGRSARAFVRAMRQSRRREDRRGS